MSVEKFPTTNESKSKDETVLVKNPETGEIDVLRTAGIEGQRFELDGSITPTELVGIAESPRDVAMKGGRFVESSELQPDHQDQFARELSGLPLRGDRIVAKFGDELTTATVDNYTKTEDDRKVAIVKNRFGERTYADPRAVGPEVQAMMERDYIAQRAEKVGEAALDALGVGKPLSQEGSK